MTNGVIWHRQSFVFGLFYCELKNLKHVEEGVVTHAVGNCFKHGHNVKNVNAAKKAIKKAFQNQIDGKGFSLVEVISACPTNWGMTPQEALKWVETDMLPYYPLGVYKDRSAAKEEK